MKKFAVISAKTDSPVTLSAEKELARILYECAGEYPPFFSDGSEFPREAYTRIYIGTREDELCPEDLKSELVREEGYAIRASGDEAFIFGYDEAGLLYGVQDFYCKYILRFAHPTDNPSFVYVPFCENEKLPDFRLVSAPAVKERGLWTWGHVIYDYRGYLDNMMRLKLNRIIIWNDYPPMNAAEIVAYAHTRNIRVIWGFSWLWDTNCALADMNSLDRAPQEIFATYERDYAPLAGDGIYFQTFTELQTEYIGEHLIAEAAVGLVNRTVALLYEKYPSLEIQFGLHAGSVRNRLDFIRKVDPRVRIVWENSGSFPLAGTPSPTPTAPREESLSYARHIACLRGEEDRFGTVTKGIIGLDWTTFTHPSGRQYIGLATKEALQKRKDFRRPHLRAIVAGWLAHADEVHAAIRTLCEAKKGNLLIAALVEDGLFEEDILYPVALQAEMLWSPDTDLKTLQREVALREYVSFA